MSLPVETQHDLMLFVPGREAPPVDELIDQRLFVLVATLDVVLGDITDLESGGISRTPEVKWLLPK